MLDLDARVVHAQNAARARNVDPDVIDRHLGAIRRTVDGEGLAVEGVDQVVVLGVDEVVFCVGDRGVASVDAQVLALAVVVNHDVPVRQRLKNG